MTILLHHFQSRLKNQRSAGTVWIRKLLQNKLNPKFTAQLLFYINALPESSYLCFECDFIFPVVQA